jgi:hypothetical protein
VLVQRSHLDDPDEGQNSTGWLSGADDTARSQISGTDVDALVIVLLQKLSEYTSDSILQ